MTILIIVKADTNDADYIHRLEYFDTELDWYPDVEKYLNLLINALNVKHKEFHKPDGTISWSNRRNWDTTDGSRSIYPTEMYSGILTEDDIDAINEYFIPFWEGGIHTIVEIKKIIIQDNETELFQV